MALRRARMAQRTAALALLAASVVHVKATTIFSDCTISYGTMMPSGTYSKGAYITSPSGSHMFCEGRR